MLGGLACALLLAGSWLLLPRVQGGAGRPAAALRACLVDASASCVRRRPDWLSWVRRSLAEEAATARSRGEEIAVITFGALVVVSAAPEPAPDFLDRLDGADGRTPFDPRDSRAASDPSRDGSTDLAGAVEAAAELVLERGRRPGTLVLLGEGTYTGPDPAPGLARLARAGIRVSVHEPPPARLADLALLELSLPRRLEAGAPLGAVASLVFAPGEVAGSQGFLDVEIEHEGQVSTRSLALELRPRGGPLLVPIDCGRAEPGRTLVRASIRLASGPDPVPENDRAQAACRVAGTLLAGVVARAPDLAAARAALAPSPGELDGFEVVFLRPEELATSLFELDLLVSADLATAELPGRIVDSFVADGGGWLALCGWRFLRDGFPARGAPGAEQLLPLRPAPRDGPRDVVLLVDGSGSMAGAPFEAVRAASLDLVTAVAAEDRVSLRFFTGKLEEEQVLKEPTGGALDDAALREAARARLAARVPGGTTRILGALEELASRSTASETLVLLLSDGREGGTEQQPEPDRAARSARLRASFAERGIRLVVIAVGADAALDFLALLAGSPTEVRRAGELGDLSALFEREVLGERVVEASRVEVRWAAHAEGSLAATIAGPHAVELPPLERHARAVSVPGAEVVWESANGAPLLGVQRVDRGRTALFVSLPTRDWASEWAGSAGRRAFENLLRWLARGDRPSPDELGARIDGERVLLRGLGSDAAPRIRATVLDGRGEPAKGGASFELFPPAELGSDPLGSRAGELPAGLDPADLAPGALLALEGERRIVPLEQSLAPEFSGAEQRLDLASLAREPLARSDAGARSASRAGPWLVLGGLVLLFVASVLRRGVPEWGQGIERDGR